MKCPSGVLIDCDDNAVGNNAAKLPDSGHLEPISAIGQVKRYVITGSYDHTIRKWDMITCRCLNVYSGELSGRPQPPLS